MAWIIEIDDHAVKQIAKLGRADASRIRDFIANRIAILDNPRLAGKALQGSKLGDLWRYHIGDYRIICDLQDERLVVLVVEVGHRREIYR